MPQQKPPAGVPYSTEEIQFMRDNYKKMTWKEIAEKLGRPRSSVVDKAGQLRLLKRVGNSKHNTERSTKETR